MSKIHKGTFIGRRSKGWETDLEKDLFNEMMNISMWTTTCGPFEEVIKGEIKKLNRLSIFKKRSYEASFTDIGAVITVTKTITNSNENSPTTIGEYLVLYPI